MTEPEEQPEPGIDMSRPSIARVYDAVLGGKDNYAVDRVVADEVRRTMPHISDVGWYNRAVLGRMVRHLTTEAGIRQFLDLGAGLPTLENTHQVAQRHAPDARVVYVDIDPIVLAHGRALLEENERTTVVTADLRDPKAVLGHEGVRRLIDFSQPVGVLLVGMLHHLHDDEDPQGVVDAYMAAVPSGSHLVVTHFCDTGPEARAVEETMMEFLGTGRFRTLDEIGAYFRGLDLLDPGVVPLPQWRPDAPVDGPLTVAHRLMAGGVARKP
ncbi:SAM-dependent methyltransferase [Streptomyces sp. DSM 44917]|uniref:SAM-dependent methyltransferase n=1 Tax=Streptomyces boetiae TaxID=3075541 RepID=A0ABU2L756_9ACTN|nr:SAM-dependent methyltransferase [Streptomyces sp. DSM 44917]MDT0307399.1 SAM-dependent methyltransferase [Streptomyces sp. DSM 44917]